jgi:hypothetical protein
VSTKGICRGKEVLSRFRVDAKAIAKPGGWRVGAHPKLYARTGPLAGEDAVRERMGLGVLTSTKFYVTLM